ncbi:MAG: delta-60 repeat domain-containing protein [Syntrophales bacterium]
MITRFAAVVGVFTCLSLFACGGGGGESISHGYLDSSFNPTNGYVFFRPPGFTSARGGETVMQQDGKIVVAGWGNNGANDDLLVVRFSRDGYLDTSFGTGGFVRYNASGDGNDRALGVALQPDGRILVTGYATVKGSPKRDVIVLRLNTDGGLDTTFGSGGVFIYNGAVNVTDIGFGVAVQQDGKILIAGESGAATSQDGLILRLMSDGSLDSTFANNGRCVFNGSGNDLDRFFGVRLQADGKIVAFGATAKEGKSDSLMVRLLQNGALDASFGSGGAVTYDGPAGQNDYANDLALQADGKIVITGAVGTAKSFSVFIARYHPNGQPDNGFGSGGTVIYQSPADLFFYGYSIAIQADGRLLVTGTGSNGLNNDIFVMRFNGNGSFDEGFGSSGVALYNISSEKEDSGYGMALQSDGRIVVTGASADNQGERLLVMRLMP